MKKGTLSFLLGLNVTTVTSGASGGESQQPMRMQPVPLAGAFSARGGRFVCLARHQNTCVIQSEATLMLPFVRLNRRQLNNKPAPHHSRHPGAECGDHELGGDHRLSPILSTSHNLHGCEQIKSFLYDTVATNTYGTFEDGTHNILFLVPEGTPP